MADSPTLREAGARFIEQGRSIGYALGVRAAAARVREARDRARAQIETAAAKLPKAKRARLLAAEQRWLDALEAMAAVLDQTATAADAQAAAARDGAERLLAALEAPQGPGAAAAERLVRTVAAARSAWRRG